MSHWPRQPLRIFGRTATLLFAAAIALVAAPFTFAQEGDHSRVVRVLREGRDFRARVQAALTLGGTRNVAMTPHLVSALADEHAGVRAAAATSLGTLGDPAALTPLRRALRDQAQPVRAEAERAIQRIEAALPPTPPSAPPNLPGALGSDPYPTISVLPQAEQIHWPRVRHVVVLGSMQNRSALRDDQLDDLLQREVMRNLIVLRGIAVLQDGREPLDADREIRRRRLAKLRLEGSLNRLERTTQSRQVSVRAEVSIMLMDDGRNLRAALNGAATGSQQRLGERNQQERQLTEQALTGAVRSAMSGVAQAIASATRR